MKHLPKRTPKPAATLIVLAAMLFLAAANIAFAADPPGSVDPFATSPLLLLDEEMIVLSQNDSAPYDIISDVFLPRIVADEAGNRKEWADLNDKRTSWTRRPPLTGGKIGDAAVLLRDSTNKQFLAQVWNDLTVSLAPVNHEGYGDERPSRSLPGGGGGVAVTAGDLNGDRATELVVGYRRADGKAGIAALAVEGQESPLLFDGADLPLVHEKSGLRIAAGDTNADGRAEIAALYVSDAAKYTVALFGAELSTEGKLQALRLLGIHTLDLASSSSLFFDSDVFDIAFADWEGNGKAKLFCVARTSASQMEARTIRLLSVEIREGKALFTTETKFSRNFDGRPWDGNPDPVRAAAGDVSGNGKDDILFTVTPADYMYAIALVGIYRRDDGTPGFTGERGFDYGYGGRGVRLKTGSFTGSLHPSSSGKNRMQAVLTLGNTIFLVALDGGALVQRSSVNHPSGALRGSHVLVGDLDGDSMLLGTPTHIVMEDNVTPLLFLNEPPKHIDPDAKGQVVNSTREDKLYIQYAESEEKSKETTNTLEVENNIGGSLSSEVNVALKLGVGKVSAGVKATYERSSQEKRSDIAKEFSSKTASLAGRTERDDFVLFRSHRIDIWRYPVLGWMSEVEGLPGKAPTFYQIVIPDSRAESQALHLMTGMNVDWYHPVHMNGSILSYPSGMGQIGDLKEEDLLTGLVTLDVGGGNPASRGIDWKSESSRESLKAVSNKMGGDVEMQISAKSSYLFVKAQMKIKGTFHRDTRTTTTGVSKTSVRKQNAFSVEVPGISSTLRYAITPLMYRTQNGVLKTPHTVGNIVGNTAWENMYGGKPDPALNLPRIWQYTNKGWEWKGGDASNPDARKIRGIFFRNEENADLGKFLPLGEPVTIAVRVHNLSLADCPPVEVRFEAVRYNPQGRTVAIGTARTPPISRWGAPKANWEWATVKWNTAGMEEGNYKIRVIVNSDRSAVRELPNRAYEESYDNNHGWYDVKLAKDPNKVAAELGLSDEDLDLNLVALSLDLANTPADGKAFEVGEPVLLRGTVKNEGVLTKGNISLFFYDGDPARGGIPFANRIISGIGPGEQYSLVATHIFNTAGPRMVYMRVAPNEKDDPDDNVVSIAVPVHGGGTASGGGCAAGNAGAWSALLLIGLGPLALKRMKRRGE